MLLLTVLVPASNRQGCTFCELAAPQETQHSRVFFQVCWSASLLLGGTLGHIVLKVTPLL
jgi:hypothetical protein